MKMVQRIISGLLSVCLTVSMLPMHVWAEEIMIEDVEAAEAIVETAAAAGMGTVDDELTMLPAETVSAVAATEPEETIPETTVPEETANTTSTTEEPIAEENVAANAVDVSGTASGICGENLTWTLVNGVLTISGTGEMSTNPWKIYSEQILSIVIEDGVTFLTWDAFNNCKNLKKVEIPDSVVEFGVVEPMFNHGVQYGEYTSAFLGCDGITSIGPIGSDCDLEYGWTEAFPENAFWGLRNVNRVIVPETISRMDDIFFLFDSRENLTTAGPIGSGCNYEFGWKRVIPASAFYNFNALQRIILPTTVKEIGSNAFSGCGSLNSINLPSGIKRIERGLFSNCWALEEIAIPSGVTEISEYAFYSCGKLRNVSIPLSVAEIGEWAFADCGELENVTLPENMTTIEHCVFHGCKSLKKIIIPSAIEVIDVSAFSGCDAITSAGAIGSGADFEFGWYDKIPAYAFTGFENLSKITVPESIAAIDPTALENCHLLTSIGPVGSGCAFEFEWKEIIPENAFAGLSAVDKIIIPGTITTISPFTFSRFAINSVGPIGSGCDYEFGWIEEIPTNAFHGLKINKVIMPGTIKRPCTFSSVFCPELTSAGPIGSGCAYEYGWETKIPDNAFSYMQNLSEFQFPELTNGGITEIGSSAFYYCKSLTEITIPETVTKIGNQAFNYCTSLKKLTIPESVNLDYMIGCITNCSALEELEILGYLRYIQGGDLIGCTNLRTIVLPRSLKRILEYAFRDCTELTDVYYMGSQEEWDKIIIHETGNEPLFNALLHTDYSGWNAVYYYEEWNEERGTVGFLNAPDLLVTEKTDSGFIGNPTALLGEYVLVTALPAAVAGTNTDVLLNMTRADMRIGYVESVHGDTININGTAYKIPASISEPEDLVGCRVLFVLNNGSILQLEALEYTEALFVSWVPETRKLKVKWDAPEALPIEYQVNSGLDTETRDFLENCKPGTVVRCLKDKNGIVHAVSDEIIDGEFSYLFDGVDIYKYTFHYDEGWFDKDSAIYQHDLARMSLRVAMAAGDLARIGGTEVRNQNIRFLMKDLGFDYSEEYSNYPDPEYDTIGYAMGSKEIISASGERSTLVMVAVRGSGYYAEWAGNFWIGLGEYTAHHEGFDTAALQVRGSLLEYVTDLRMQKPDQEIKIWISGYSRAGATTNLVAARLIDAAISYIPPENIFAFCFECPKNTTDTNCRSGKYDRIVNIINPIDLVPHVAMQGLGFDRYGTDYYLPNAEATGDYYMDLRDYLYGTYTSILEYVMPTTEALKKATEYIEEQVDQAGVIERGMDTLSDFAKSRTYFSRRYQPIIMDAFLAMNNGTAISSETEMAMNALLAGYINLSNLGLLLLAEWDLLVDACVDAIPNAHLPTLCLAWMDTVDNLTVQGNRHSRKLIVNWDADIAVYRDGKLVAEISNGVPKEIENGIPAFVDFNGQKTVILPGDAIYDIRMTAGKNSEIDVTFVEKDTSLAGSTRVIGYKNEFIPAGDVVEGVAGDMFRRTSARYALFMPDGTEIMPTLDQSGDEVENFRIRVLAEGTGSVSGGGRYVCGEYAKVTVNPVDDYHFVGWYVDGVCVSQDAEYRFRVTADTEITAKFVESVEEITVSHEYILLEPGQTQRLSATVYPEVLADRMSWSVEEGDEGVISIDAMGTVTALSQGTVYAIASILFGDRVFTARCRVDVTESMEIDGIQLSTNKLNVERYSADYATVDVLLKLPQNYSAQSVGTRTELPDLGVAIEAARFTDERIAELFTLGILDDRTLSIVPTEKGMDEAKGKYVSSVTVTVAGTEYESEAITLTVKNTLPKLKATISNFNSFYSGQSQKIQITGATVTNITATSLPNWLTLDGNNLILNGETVAKNASGKAVLQIETEEWNIPAAITLNVRNSYKAPGLKLSATNVNMSADSVNSNGAQLKLMPSNKKDTLESLKVTGITASNGYVVENFNVADGTFILKAMESAVPGKIAISVSFEGTDEKLNLNLTVKNTAVTLKLSSTNITLNPDIGDAAKIIVTATPADYRVMNPTFRLEDSKKNDKLDSGELELGFANGTITVSTTNKTPNGATYKLYISAGGSREVSATIKTVENAPSMTLKATGSIDISFPENEVVVTPNFKNYSGAAIESWEYSVAEMKGKNVLNANAGEFFEVAKDVNAFCIRCTEPEQLTMGNTYNLTLKLALPNGSICENTVKLTIKQTALKLKLSATTITLNKTISDSAEITVASTTKGYTLGTPVWQLMDKTGKVSAEGKLDIAYNNGKLSISVNENTEFAASYKLLVKASEKAAATTLTVNIPAQNRSAITGTIKLVGGIDVIRDGSSVTVTPAYKNCGNEARRTERLEIYSSADKYTEPVTDLFEITRNENGSFAITKSGEVDHTLKYQAKLVTDFGNGVIIESKLTSLKVTMGTAKLTANADSTTMFAKDKNCRVTFTVTSTDNALNKVKTVEIKDKKYQNFLEVIPYGNGEFAIGYKEGKVDSGLIGKAVTLNLNVFLEGNESTKVNGTVNLKLTFA